MHDDITLTTGRAHRVLTERIWPAVHATSVPLDVERHALPGEPIPPREGLALAMEPYEVGTPWGPAWGTTWFRLTGIGPAEWAGRAVEAVIDLGFDASMPGFQAEALVYRPDGTTGEVDQPAQPVRPGGRRRVRRRAGRAAAGGGVQPRAARARPVQADPGGRHHRRRRPHPLYTTRRMDLAIFEAEVHDLALDVEVLLELQAELPTGPRRMRILQALDDALDVLDLQRISETAAAARAALADVLARARRSRAPTRSRPSATRTSTPPGCGPCARRSARSRGRPSSMADLIDRTDDFVYGMSSAPAVRVGQGAPARGVDPDQGRGRQRAGSCRWAACGSSPTP